MCRKAKIELEEGKDMNMCEIVLKLQTRTVLAMCSLKGHAIPIIKSLRVSLQYCAYRGLEPTSFVE